jgi:hypothetical protein
MITWLIASSVALAGDLYKVENYGVEVTMADKWVGIRFSDDDFQAEKADHSVKFMLNGVKAQDNPSPSDANWPVSVGKSIEALVGVPVVAGAVSADDVGDLKRLRLHFDYEIAKGNKGAADVLVYPVDGATVVQLTYGEAAKQKGTLEAWEKQVTIKKPAKALEDGPVVKIDGATTDLPAGWHVAGPQELLYGSRRTEPLGVKSLEGCWMAVSPRGMYEPALLIGCPISMRIGILDEYDFADKEADLRAQLFGNAPIQPGVMLSLSDRAAVQYHVPIQEKAVDLIVVPDSTGLARFWALGQAAESAVLTAALTDAVKATTFDGPHPVTADDYLGYYPVYRPFSPVTLGGAGGCLCSVAGLFGMMFLGSRLAAARRAAQDAY